MDNNKQSFPEVFAIVKGSADYPEIYGEIIFSEVYGGTVVSAYVTGLPENDHGNFFGFHIHEGNQCTGDSADPFKAAGSHYNPAGMNHPWHAGDMPVLMGNDGTAWGTFYTNRFYPEDILGRTVIIHDMPDDFRSQPSGDAGTKIACGVVRMTWV